MLAVGLLRALGATVVLIGVYYVLPLNSLTRVPLIVVLTVGLLLLADAKGPYAVTRVVDGDTAKVSINGRSITVRLIGIDTPETKHSSKPVQCFGQEASARAKALLTG